MALRDIVFQYASASQYGQDWRQDRIDLAKMLGQPSGRLVLNSDKTISEITGQISYQVYVYYKPPEEPLDSEPKRTSESSSDRDVLTNNIDRVGVFQ